MFSSSASQVSAANYIEDVFSTYLYTGTGASQTITNGIDLSGKGGLVWTKDRNPPGGTGYHSLIDTDRGNNFVLSSNSTSGNDPGYSSYFTFNNNGFSFPISLNRWNQSAINYASWTFRKQAKFFDVVTYTGDGSGSDQIINHNLGSTPGCIIVKCTSNSQDWLVWHRATASSNDKLFLNLTNAVLSGYANGVQSVTSTSFRAAGNDTALNYSINVNGRTYVAYLFAHDAGGFGASGSDNVISCGSYTGDGTDGQFVNVGFEVQWLLVKRTNAVGDWFLVDVMRGALANGAYPCANLYPNLSSAETLAGTFGPDPRGFRISASTSTNASGSPFIYIAIRRGPMKTPTSGTSVFSPIASSAATGTALTTSFPVDAQIFSLRSGTTNKNNTYDRLRGVSSTTTESGARLITSSTAAETAAGNETRLWNNTGFQMPSTFGGASTVFWNFGRAPGFFDVVCYTGTGAVNTLNHNLGVVPEIWIIKRRTGGAGDWFVGGGLIGSGTNALLNLNTTAATVSGLTNLWLTPTSTTFGIGSYNPSDNGINASGSTYVAYLFATVAGVSKVGSYTGTGTTKQIDCGFTGGARFVLIKRTDSTGNWYVWDSARGIVAGNDPYLLLNSTAAEVTSTDYVDTYSAGFEISSTAPAAINANGGSFIFLAIA